MMSPAGGANGPGGSAGATTPICRCRVIYLGSAVPHVTKDGLQGIQEPLRDLYPDEVTLAATLSPNSGENTAGIDSWLSVWSNGILVENVDDSGRPVKRFYPIESLHYCAAVRYVEVNGMGMGMGLMNGTASTMDSGSERAGPSAASVAGGGAGGSTVGEKIAKFLPLDSPFARSADPRHPPLFACILRRTTGIKVLECHAFICKREQASNALVRCIFHAYADCVYAKQVETESPYAAVADSRGRSRSVSALDSVQKVEAWRSRSTSQNTVDVHSSPDDETDAPLATTSAEGPYMNGNGTQNRPLPGPPPRAKTPSDLALTGSVASNSPGDDDETYKVWPGRQAPKERHPSGRSARPALHPVAHSVAGHPEDEIVGYIEGPNGTMRSVRSLATGSTMRPARMRQIPIAHALAPPPPPPGLLTLSKKDRKKRESTLKKLQKSKSTTMLVPGPQGFMPPMPPHMMGPNGPFPHPTLQYGPPPPVAITYGPIPPQFLPPGPFTTLPPRGPPLTAKEAKKLIKKGLLPPMGALPPPPLVPIEGMHLMHHGPPPPQHPMYSHERGGPTEEPIYVPHLRPVTPISMYGPGPDSQSHNRSKYNTMGAQSLSGVGRLGPGHMPLQPPPGMIMNQRQSVSGGESGSERERRQRSAAERSLARERRRNSAQTASQESDGVDSPNFNSGIYRRKPNLNEKAFSYSIRQETRSRSNSVANLSYSSPEGGPMSPGMNSDQHGGGPPTPIQNGGPPQMMNGYVNGNGGPMNGGHHPAMNGQRMMTEQELSDTLNRMDIANGGPPDPYGPYGPGRPQYMMGPPSHPPTQGQMNQMNQMKTASIKRHARLTAATAANGYGPRSIGPGMNGGGGGGGMANGYGPHHGHGSMNAPPVPLPPPLMMVMPNGMMSNGNGKHK